MLTARKNLLTCYMVCWQQERTYEVVIWYVDSKKDIKLLYGMLTAKKNLLTCYMVCWQQERTYLLVIWYVNRKKELKNKLYDLLTARKNL